jgi:N-acetylglucosaminyl-diphospho-decaprenol L-rhamnosyltransferase
MDTSEVKRIRYAVLIVNYNSADHAGRAVRSVLRHARTEEMLVQIVDNDSEPNDRKTLRALAGPHVQVHELRRNLGFARGNNEAVKIMQRTHLPEFIVFMNPDVEIISDGTIEDLIADIMNSGVGIIGSQPLVWNPSKAESAAAQVSGRRFPSLWDLVICESLFLRLIFRAKFGRYIMADSKPHCGLIPCEVPSGAFFVITHSAFGEVSGFYDGTFLYGEELFLAAGLRLRGWRFVFDSNIRVVHFQGSSTGFKRGWPRRRMFVHHCRSLCAFARTRLRCSEGGAAMLRIAMEVGFLCRLVDAAMSRIRDIGYGPPH